MIVANPKKLVELANEYHKRTSEWMLIRKTHGPGSTQEILARGGRANAAVDLADHVDSGLFKAAAPPLCQMVASEADVNKGKGTVGLALGLVMELEDYVRIRDALSRPGGSIYVELSEPYPEAATPVKAPKLIEE